MSVSLLNSSSNNFYFHCFLNSLAKMLSTTSIFVSEHPGCQNKMVWTAHGLGTTEMSFSQFLRKIQAPADIVAGSWFRWLSFHCVLTWRKGQGISGISFVWALIHEAPLSWPKHLPKDLPPNTSSLGVKISIYEPGKDTDTETRALHLK